MTQITLYFFKQKEAHNLTGTTILWSNGEVQVRMVYCRSSTLTLIPNTSGVGCKSYINWAKRTVLMIEMLREDIFKTTNVIKARERTVRVCVPSISITT